MKASRRWTLHTCSQVTREPPELEIGETTRVDQGVAAEIAALIPSGFSSA